MLATLALADDCTVMLKAISCELAHDFYLGSVSTARLVYVFNTQQPLAIGCTRISIAGNGCDQGAEMKRPGR